MAYLGDISQMMIGTFDLATSIAFYESIGFRVVDQNTQPNPWAQVTDDTILILLNQDDNTYVGLGYFNLDMPAIVAKLKEQGVNFIHEINKDGKPFQAIFTSPSGFPVSLINHDNSAMFQPAGKTLADIPQDQWANAPAPNPNLGIFGELAIPVKDIDAEIAFWESVGFQVTKFDGPYAWAIGQDGQHVIGMHSTTEFTEPGITFFAKDMADKIKTLKNRGVPAFRAFTGTGGNNDANQVLDTPEGQQFFLFSF